jgi:hypothetical protein
LKTEEDKNALEKMIANDLRVSLLDFNVIEPRGSYLISRMEVVRGNPRNLLLYVYALYAQMRLLDIRLLDTMVVAD